MDDDQLLISRAVSGDRSAFGDLALKHQDRLYASMLAVTGSAEEAEDVVQDALVRAFLKLDSFQQNSQFFTWLYRIAFNVALSRFRKRRHRVSIDQSREVAGMEPVDHSGQPDDPILQREQVNLVQNALQQLTEQHRAILILREMNECSYEEIAEILDISIGTVRSRISRARSSLKQVLEAWQSADESR